MAGEKRNRPITRHLFGAGKGDSQRPSQVSEDLEKANWSLAFNQCYACGDRKVPHPVRVYVKVPEGNAVAIFCEYCAALDEDVERADTSV